MNVIIFYEHLTREWDAVQRLKDGLEKKGARVKVYSLIFQRTAARLDALTHHPDVIYLPWFMVPSHEQILEPIVRHSPKVILINQHQEQVGSPSSESQLYPITEATRNGAYHFAWGDHFKQILLKQKVNPETIYITGSIRNDAGGKIAISKEELAKTYHLDPAKKWVLFAENRGWLRQRNTEGTIQELISLGATREELEKGIEYEVKSLDLLYGDMEKLDDSFYRDFELIYRPHPGTQLDAKLPDRVHVITDRSIYDWINASSLFLTSESTSIFEAELCGVACATLDHVEKNPAEMMAGLPDYPQIHSLQDINSGLIENLLRKQKEKAPIYERYIGKVDGHACDRTIAATMEVMKKEPLPLHLKKSTFYLNLHQFLFEAVTFVMVNLRLLQKCKFPKSAYVEMRDIPYSPDNKWIRKK